MRSWSFVEMSKIGFIVFALFLFLFLFASAEAEKEPLWEWESSSGISHVAISDDSRNISATYATSVSLWHNNTTLPRDTNIVGEEITSMVMSSDGKYVLTGESYDTTVTLWEDGSRAWETSNFLQTIIELDISPDGTHIAVADWKNVLFFNKDSNEAVWSYNHASEIMSTVSISPNGLFIAAGTEDGKVYVYPTSGDNTSSWFHDNVLDEGITGIDFSADSSHFIIGTETGRVYVYETEEGPPVMELVHPDGKITCVSGSSDSDYYAFGTNQGSVVVINSNIDNIEWEKTIGGIVTDIDFNGNATHLVAGSTSERLVLAKVLNGDELWRIVVSGEVSGVAMSYRGENIVVGTDEGLAIYYEQRLDNQAPIATIESITPTTALPGTSITMNGSVVDSDGEVVNYLWYSSVDGNLSNERIFTVSNLTMGLHVITFSAQDNEGRWSKEVSLTIGVGDFPDAIINSVSDCDLLSVCVISEGATIEFNGSAVSEASNDTEVIGYYWMSDLDGFLSSQSVFSISNLSRGSHNITFRAVNDIGFWSSNITLSLLINAIPVSSIVSVDPNPVQPGQSLFLIAYAEDPDDSLLTYIWSSDTLLFANGKNLYDNSETNGSRIDTTESDVGEHDIYLRVVDSHGVSSDSSKVTVQILSPPLVSAQCETEASLGQDLLFNAVVSDRDGYPVLYEWDFNSTSGNIDSVDFQGTSFAATHSYNSTPVDFYYTVVVRVTDNDGLVASDTCTVEMMQPTPSSSSDDGSSSGSALDSIPEIASPSVMAGIGLIVLIVGAVTYYMMSRDEMPYVPPSTTAPVTGAQYMSSIVPEVSPVRQSEVVTQEIVTETMTVECPECSARMDIPNILGAQQIECSECGLEGEIEL
jgi:hypothetical protein